MKFTRFLAGALVATATISGCTGPATSGESSDGSQPEATWSVSCPDAEKSGSATDFPSQDLPCLGGDDTYDVAALHSGPKLVTLWASWCKPCRDEAPAFEEFHKAMGDEVTVIGVDTQDAPERGRYFAQDFSWTFPSVVDENGSVMRSQGISALPATFLIDADGNTVTTFSSGNVTAQDLFDAAETELEVNSS